MTAPSGWNLLSAHHLLHQIHELVDRAKSHAVLVTAYLDTWPSLEHVLRQAVARGVAVHLIVRSVDSTHNDATKRAKTLDRVRALGVEIHEVDWLHTKLYLNESEAIVTSLNLTATGRDGPNLGVHLHGSGAARQALDQLDQWMPDFARKFSTPVRQPVRASGYCIRCCAPRDAFTQRKPYCRTCWQASRTDLMVEAYCHRCGCRAPTTHDRPLCESCFASPRASLLAVV